MPPHPRATYRIQLHPEFGFDEAAAIADYLAVLGVSHLYASPYLQAAPGSPHGYDIVDHARVNCELGGPEGHRRLCGALREQGLGQLLDIVPNHMAVGVAENAWWWDVLENGAKSRYAAYFDVDWGIGGDDRILLPILAERYVDALESRLIRLDREGEALVVRYRDHRLPACRGSVATLAAGGAPDARALARINDDIDALDAFLERQNWRLAYWKAAATDLSYRPFFDVTTLAGLRMEDPEVFAKTHTLILSFLREGAADGVRIDHLDGLRDPEQYLLRLRAQASSAWILVEKILAENERLPQSWPVHGTTGYEVLRLLDQVQVDAVAEGSMTELAHAFAGSVQDWSEMAREAKLQILDEVLASERERVVDLAHRTFVRRLPFRDCTRHEMRMAISELLVSFPCYRTYVRPGTPARDEDVATVRDTVERASRRRSELGSRFWSALEDVLLMRSDESEAIELALRIQQLTGPIAAKAIEDTLFYRYARLVALNEVGGSPETFGISVDAFHAGVKAQAQRHGLIATSTHDTKRGEDVRARLIALSQMPEEWSAAVRRWSERSRRQRGEALDGCIEYLFYQTLVGAHPLSLERMWCYMQKAIREAKQHTSWTRPDLAYEGVVESFVRGVYSDPLLMEDVSRFVAELAPVGFSISLSRTLIKLTLPGVPDFYQGSELWDLNLVDPDNRGAVDFVQRRRLLQRVQELSPEAAMEALESGVPKLFLISRALALRKKEPELFEGEYRPLEVVGRTSAATLAFMRSDRLATVAPRLARRHPPGDREDQVRLPPGRWRNVLTGDAVEEARIGPSVRDLWRRFPVALLVRES